MFIPIPGLLREVQSIVTWVASIKAAHRPQSKRFLVASFELHRPRELMMQG
jgi:hypothetical protein